MKKILYLTAFLISGYSAFAQFISGPTNPCYNVVYTYTYYDDVQYNQAVWSVGGGGTITGGSGLSRQIKWTSDGWIYVQLKQNGNVVSELSIDITVASAGYISGPSSVCAGNSVTITKSGTTGTYNWQASTNGGGTWSNLGSAATLVHTPTATTTLYRIAATVCGSTQYTNTVTVTRYTTPVAPTIYISNAPTSVCTSGTVSWSLPFSSSPSASLLTYLVRYKDGVSGSWSSYSTFAQAGPSFPVQYYSAGPASATVERYYEFYIIASNPSCVTTNSNVVSGVVYPVTSPGSISGPASVCAGNSVTITKSGTTAAYTWQTSSNGGSSWTDLGSAADLVHTPTVTTTLYRIAASVCGATQYSNTHTVTRNNVPVPPTIYISNAPASVCPSGNVTWSFPFSASPDAASLDYRVRYKDGFNGAWSSYSTFASQAGPNYTLQYYTAGPAAQDRYYEFQVAANRADCTPIMSNTVSAVVYRVASIGMLSASPTALYGTANSVTLAVSSFYQSLFYEKSTDGINWTPAATVNFNLNQTTYFRAVATGPGESPCAPAYSNTVTVNVYPSPTVTIHGAQEIVPGLTTELRTQSSYHQYQWKKDDADIPGATAYNLSVTEPGNYKVQVKGDASAPWATSATVTIGYALGTQPITVNYHVVNNIFKEGYGVNSNVYSLGPQEIKQSVNYMDGYGRTIQQVAIGQTPAQHDVIAAAQYDKYGRSVKTFLPYASSATTGKYRPSALKAGGNYMGSEQHQFYNTGGLIAADSAYATTVFEPSPLGRVLEQGAPGADWQPGTGHTVKSVFRVINSGYSEAALKDARTWTVNGPTGSYYANNTLAVAHTTDENGNNVWTFTDYLGHTLLKRVQLDDYVEGVYTPFLETYYVYDDRGNLALQVPPKAMAKINAGTAWSTAFRNEWCYVYVYDSRNRLIEKKVPDADWVYYGYDRLDRLVLTQDGHLRGPKQWAFIKYDSRNRPVMAGLYTNTTHTTRASIQTNVLDPLYASGVWYEEKGTALHGYTNASFPTQNHNGTALEVLSVNYYDNYDFDNSGTDDYAYTPRDLPGEGAQGSSYGLPTGNKRLILGTTNWLYSYVFYDKHGRAIQTRGNNHLSLDADKLDTYTYNFNGTLAYAQTEHQGNMTTRQRMEYDHTGRPVKLFHALNGGGEVLAVAYEYNELGQLTGKNLHWNQSGQAVTADPLVGQPGVTYGDNLTANQYNGEAALIGKTSVTLTPGFTAAAGSAFIARTGYSQADANHHNSTITEGFLQSIDYRYNIRGWLTSINNSQLTIDNKNDDANDYFGMELLYNQTESGLSNTLYYNGNVSALKWKGPGDGTGASGQRSYKMSYDKTDKLKAATFQARGASVWDKETNTLNEAQTYDANGNILTLQRHSNQRGLSGVNVTSAPQLMDNLTYTYATGSGNKLTNVEDSAPAEGGFTNGTTEATEFTWNTNGSLTQDKNKGISNIAYNMLGKPATVTFTDGRVITYVYDGAGSKLSMSVTQSGNTLTTDYAGNFVYENGNLAFFGSPEGRIIKNGSNYERQYAISDHQGNTRVVFSSVTPAPAAKTATFEGDENDNVDEFTNVNVSYVWAHPNANHTPGGAGVVRMNQTYKVGPAKSVKVYTGDVIDAEVWAYYESGSGYGTTSPAMAVIMNAVSLAFGGAGGGMGESLKIHNGVSNAYGAFGLAGNQGDYVPAAYLNYILFDQQYNVLDMGWRPVTSASSWNKAKVSFDPINIKEAGFIFVYLSYENESSNWVYFDDFKVTHTKSNIMQYNEYYPFGLQTANSWTRENSANNFLYNAGSELNNATSNYEMFFREYDPALGRMNAVDPMASKYASLTPYNYAFNDPVYYNDPLGDDARSSTRGGYSYASMGGCGCWRDVGPQDASGGTSMYGSSWNYETYGGGFAKYGVGVSYGGMTGAQYSQMVRDAGNLSVGDYTAKYGGSPTESQMRYIAKALGLGFMEMGNNEAYLTTVLTPAMYDSRGNRLADQVNGVINIALGIGRSDLLGALNGYNKSGGLGFKHYGWLFLDGFIQPELAGSHGYSLLDVSPGGAADGLSYVAGVGYLNSKFQAKNYASTWEAVARELKGAKAFSIGGKAFGAVGATLPLVVSFLEGRNPSAGEWTKAGLGAVSVFTGVYGVIYAVIDVGVGLTTGSSVTDRIGAGIDFSNASSSKYIKK